MGVVDFPVEAVMRKRQQEYSERATAAYLCNDMVNYITYSSRVEEIELQIMRLRGLKALEQNKAAFMANYRT